MNRWVWFTEGFTIESEVYMDRNGDGLNIPFGRRAGDFRWLVSFEDAFVPQSRHVDERPLDEYELTQHYRFWKEDIERARDLGVRMIRYGVPWYRVNPAKGRFDWEWIDKVVEHIVDGCSLELMVDLNHYNCPLWIDNEFINAGFPDYMVEYVQRFAERYRKSVFGYNPYNEPLPNALFSGELGEWPPYLHGDDGFVKVIVNIAKAVVLSTRVIQNVHPDARIVHVEASSIKETDDPGLRGLVRLKNARKFLVYELACGTIEEDRLLHGYLAENGADDRMFEWFKDRSIELDIIGINYYPQLSRSVLVKSGLHVEEKKELGYAEQLREIFLEYQKKYSRPMILTETSFFGTSGEKERWLKESCAVIKDLRLQGVPIIGYNWWFMIDSVGWDYKWGDGDASEYIGFLHPEGKKGPRKGAGLFSLKPDPSGLFRRVKLPVADTYRCIIGDAAKMVGDLEMG
jgi:beta-glucosidase/6-phospho-beta-glucosidase/beta-galactosidase